MLTCRHTQLKCAGSGRWLCLHPLKSWNQLCYNLDKSFGISVFRPGNPPLYKENNGRQTSPCCVQPTLYNHFTHGVLTKSRTAVQHADRQRIGRCLFLGLRDTNRKLFFQSCRSFISIRKPREGYLCFRFAELSILSKVSILFINFRGAWWRPGIIKFFKNARTLLQLSKEGWFD